MTGLALREARRLAPYALGAPLVGAAGAWWLATRPDRLLHLGQGLELALAGTAALLGVAAVAPDTGAGGVAFLSRLPVRPLRVVATKLAVAGALALLAGAALVALRAAVDPAGAGPAPGAGLGLAATGLRPGGAPPGPLAPLTLAAFAFAAGSAASVAARGTLPALLLAPVVALALALLGGAAPVALLRLEPWPFLPTAALLAAPPLLALGAAAYALGERHRPSLRPAAIVAAGVVALGGVGLAGTAAARSWTLHAARPGLLVVRAVEAPRGDLVAVELAGQAWPGPQRRVALLGRAGAGGLRWKASPRPRELAPAPGRSPGHLVWDLPLEDVAAPELSPCGRALLVRCTRDPGGWLVDLAAPDAPPRRLAGPAPEGFGFDHVVWLGAEPALVRERAGHLEVLRPVGLDPALPRADVERAVTRAPLDGALVGPTPRGGVLVTTPGGLEERALPGSPGARPAGPRRLATWPAGAVVHAVYPSPRGGVAVVDLDLPGLGRRFASLTLPAAGGDAPPASLGVLATAARGWATWIPGGGRYGGWAFSPDERTFAVDEPGRGLAVFDLEAGALRARLTPGEDARALAARLAATGALELGLQVAFTPDGARLTAPWGTTLALEGPPKLLAEPFGAPGSWPHARAEAVACWLDGETAVLAGRPLLGAPLGWRPAQVEAAAHAVASGAAGGAR